MQYRFLGRSGLQVSSISLGSWLTYGNLVEKERAFACMKAAFDCGVNFFDCAEEYSRGQSEKTLGEALRKFGWKRNDLVISTKIYWGGGAFGDLDVNNKGLSRKHIIEGMNGSLHRLGLDYVDLIYAHRPDRQTPIEESVRGFNHLIDTGKAFYWGTSQWNADEIAQAWCYADKLGLIGPVMEQPSYSMLEREKVEGEFAHLYREVGLGLTVFSPMRQGILSGKYKNEVPSDSRFSQTGNAFIRGLLKEWGEEGWKKVIEQVSKLEVIADRLGVKQSQLSLAWVLSDKNVSSAIIGASKPEQVYENVGALEVVEMLTPAILAEIDAILGNKPPAPISRF
ncbi:hypothetical protein FSARC_5454 [Fusarium sarcochroum]|uniref:NADP-dependent oxidoreductase domain-containing protein n=1 Tax=Fusarium sarcochroum TaxID=1208366 RepID=A0A8H4TZD2_9HYPO|nr:hypothetical protein FSARC_5454 [Fusarium sarcochroum]